MFINKVIKLKTHGEGTGGGGTWVYWCQHQKKRRRGRRMKPSVFMIHDEKTLYCKYIYILACLDAYPRYDSRGTYCFGLAS